jgi:hypothetical protein
MHGSRKTINPPWNFSLSVKVDGSNAYLTVSDSSMVNRTIMEMTINITW